MPSTYTTDPIGPRSIDEMLGVVYSRAQHQRRRRTMQRVGIAAVALLVGAAGVATRDVGDQGANVHLVDQPTTDQEATAPPVEADVNVGPARSEPQSGPARTGSAAPSADKPGEVEATVNKPAAVPTLPAESAPRLETWADGSDKLNDSQPADWYFDISATAMQFDAGSEVVVFSTSYRLPDAPLDEARTGRTLKSSFDYEGQTFEVAVTEADNELGKVRIDNTFDCNGCTARFDAPGATLRVSVPLSELNKAVTRRAAPLAAGADIMAVKAITVPAGNITPSNADVSEVA